MANALLHRYSPTLFQLDDSARQFRGMSLLELARESLTNAGVNTRGLSRDEVATRSLHSTSDFPEILSAVTNKTLRQAYETYPRTFMLFCRQVLATDFKAMNRVQLGEAPQLLEVGESGEFKRGTLGESKESYKVKTYGRVVAIIDLRVAEVPNPRPGDRVEIDGDAFLIQGEPVRDRERLVWTVDLRPA